MKVSKTDNQFKTIFPKPITSLPKQPILISLVWLYSLYLYVCLYSVYPFVCMYSLYVPECMYVGTVFTCINVHYVTFVGM